MQGEAQIDHSIRLGRVAVMVPWRDALGEEGVAQVAHYVLQIRAGKGNDDHAGKTRYLQFCSACHGAGRAPDKLTEFELDQVHPPGFRVWT